MNPSKSANFKVEARDSAQGARILTVTGPLTLQTLFDFQAVALQDAMKGVIVDISAVPFMDSAGLGCIISIFASCQRTNRGFGVVGASDRIRTLFEITHVDTLLPRFETLDAAETAVAKTGA